LPMTVTMENAGDTMTLEISPQSFQKLT
jgi:hypothetical protein